MTRNPSGRAALAIVLLVLVAAFAVLLAWHGIDPDADPPTLNVELDHRTRR